MGVKGRKRGNERVPGEWPSGVERLLTGILAATGRIVVVTDRDGRIAVWNRGAEHLYGISAEDAVGRLLFDLAVPVESHGMAREAQKRVLRGEEWAGGLDRPGRDGTGVVSLTFAAPVLDEEGGVSGTVWIGEDVTRVRREAEAYRESEERFRLLTGRANVMIAIIQGDRFAYVNPWFLRKTGVSGDAVAGRKIGEFIHPEDRKLVLDRVRRQQAGEPSPERYEFSLLARGDPFRVDVSAAPVTWRGEPALVLVGVDITDRMRVEEALRKNEERLLLALGHSPDAVFFQDRDLRYTWIVHPLGPFTPEQMYGRTDDELAVTEEDRELARIKREVLVRGEGRIVETRLRIGGEYRWFEMALEPRRTPQQETAGIFGYARDITARKQAEQALRSSHAALEANVGERTAELEHEREMLRTLLDNVPALLVYSDPVGRVVFVNREFERITGWGGEEARTRPILEDLYPDPEIRREVRGHFSMRSLQWRDFTLRTRAGEFREVTWANAFLSDGSRISIGIDITGIRRNERIAVEREKLLSTVLDSLPVGVSVLDRKGVIVMVNPSARRIWGGIRLVGPEEYDVYKGWWAGTGRRVEAGEWGAARAIRDGEAVLGEEIEIERFDGSRTVILNSSIPIRDNRGEVTGAVVVIEDISGRRAAEAEVRRYREHLEDLVEERTADLRAANTRLEEEIANRERVQAELKKIEWLLTERVSPEGGESRYVQPYGDFSGLNRSRVILDAVGREALTDIMRDILDLMGTSAAVYEANGDYAVGLFVSGWCRFLDLASRRRCGTEDNAGALRSGRWHCHESCWANASRVSIVRGQPVDIACAGGLNLYAVPIFAGDERVGSVNFGYGDPPRDPEVLRDIAARYEADADELFRLARTYESRPPFIIDVAKARLRAIARLIGAMVARKRAEDALRDANRLLETILENTHTLLAYLDSGFRFFRVNRAFARADARKPEEFPGKGHFELYPDPDTEQVFRRVVETGEPYFAYSQPFRRPNRPEPGDSRCDWSLVPIYGEGKAVTGLLLTVTDITERWRLEQRVVQLRREQEAFLRHEVKNLFLPMQLYSDLLLREPGDISGEQEHYLRRIRESADRVSALVDSLKEIHDIEAGNYPLRRTSVAPAYMVRQAIDDLEPVAAENGVTISFRSPGVTESLLLDSRLMPGVFSNLILNAIEHVAGLEDPREKIVTVDLRQEEGWTVIRINNRGEPVPPERLETFFEKFNIGPEKRHGTGLGTTYAALVVRAHGGDVSVASTPEEGTTVTVVFPKE